MEQQGDVLLCQTPDDGEINVVDGIVEMSGGLETAIYLSMFGGNEDCTGQENCPFTYWGNYLENDGKFKYKSETQHLLQQIPATSNNLLRVKDAANRDLKWVTENKIASSLEINIIIPALNKISIIVDITANGLESQFNFVENWKAK